MTGAASALNLYQLAQNTQRGLLVVRVGIRIQCLLYLPINCIQVLLLLLVGVVALVYQRDASINTVSCCLPYINSVILECLENELHILALALVEDPVKCHNRVLLTKFFKNKYGTVLLHVVGLGVAILPQELDGHGRPHIDGLGCVLAASLS